MLSLKRRVVIIEVQMQMNKSKISLTLLLTLLTLLTLCFPGSASSALSRLGSATSDPRRLSTGKHREIGGALPVGNSGPFGAGSVLARTLDDVIEDINDALEDFNDAIEDLEEGSIEEASLLLEEGYSLLEREQYGRAKPYFQQSLSIGREIGSCSICWWGVISTRE